MNADSDRASGQLRFLGRSRWQVLVNDPRWLIQIVVVFAVEVGVIALTAWVVLTHASGLVAAAFVPAVFVGTLLLFWILFAPANFFTRKTIGLLEAGTHSERAWKFAPLPLNISTLRMLAPAGDTPRISMLSSLFAVFEEQQLTIWIRRGARVVGIASFPRAEVKIVRILRSQSTKVVFSLGPVADPDGNFVLVPFRGAYRSTGKDADEALMFISAWSAVHSGG
jgi:hypothetical protein